MLTQTPTLWAASAAAQPLAILGNPSTITNQTRPPHQPRVPGHDGVIIKPTSGVTFAGGPDVDLTVYVSPPPKAGLTVTFEVDQASTAKAGQDYILNPSKFTLDFTASQTSDIITVHPVYPGSTIGTIRSVWLTIKLTGVSDSQYIIAPEDSAKVTIKPNPTPPIIGSPGPGAPGLFPGTSDSNGGNPAADSESESGIRYGNGQVNNATGQIMDSTGFGSWFGQALQWSNIAGYSTAGVFGQASRDEQP